MYSEGKKLGIPQLKRKSFVSWTARVQGNEAGAVTATEVAQRDQQARVPLNALGRSYFPDLRSGGDRIRKDGNSWTLCHPPG